MKFRGIEKIECIVVNKEIFLIFFLYSSVMSSPHSNCQQKNWQRAQRPWTAEGRSSTFFGSLHLPSLFWSNVVPFQMETVLSCIKKN